MKKRVWVLVACLAACGDDAKTGKYSVQQVELESLAAAVDCGCFWPDYEYASEAACRLDNVVLFDDTQERCVIDVGARYPSFEAGAECKLLATSAKLNCYYDFQSTCDPDGFDGCDDTYDAADAACARYDPCLGLAGADLNSCRLEESQLASETLDCFGL